MVSRPTTARALGWLLAVLVASAATACDAAPPSLADDGGVPTRVFGETCLDGSDCTSSLCIEIERHRLICTRTCERDSDCPGGASWGCVQPAEPGAPRVCGCAPDADAEVCGDGIDNECNGRVDDCRICDGRPVPEDSPDHCGACGNSCRLDQECSGGECQCPVGLLECGGRCVDPDTSTSHCGGCDRACAFRALCVEGACACPDGAPDECSGQCVDTSSHVQHCGSCGRECPATLDCVGGECACTSAGAPLYCEGSGCVDPANDREHCGACDRACPAAQVCSGGTCQCPLPGQRLCGTTCIDVTRDNANCGGCGNRCDPGAWCTDGACRCESGLVCGGTCVPYGDRDNCGGCGIACRADQYCDGRACQCLSGSECGGVCLDTWSDPTHCGSCDTVCGAGMVCSSGRCACAPATPNLCSALGACFDLLRDPMHCGSCTNECPAGQVCSSGACRCPIAGQSFCAATGTCVDLANDSANCGSCGNVCPGPTTCRSRSCLCPAGGGATYCPSVDACVDASSDPMHCGGCDVMCPAGTTCSFGACRCTTPGQTLCGTTCTDLQTDVTRCGSCTNVCAAGRSCTAGACVCPAPVAGTALRLTTSVASSDSVAIAGMGDRAGIVWVESTSRSLMLAIVGPDGVRMRTDVTLVAAGVISPAIVWTGAELGIAWGQQNAGGPYRPMFLRVAPDGTAIGSAIDVGAGWPSGEVATQVALAWHPTAGYALAGASGDTVRFQLLGADGTGSLPLAVPMTLVGGYSAPRGLELVSATDGRWAVQRSSASSGTRVQVVNADGSLTSPAFTVTGDGYAHDLAYDGTTWVMALSTWSSGTGYRPAIARGATLSTTLAVRAATSARVVEPSLTIWGREALALSAVYPDSSSTSAGSLEVTRVTLPTTATGTMTVVTPSAPLGTITTISRSWPIAATHLDATQALVAWSDTRWGQLEVYVMPVSVASCL